MTDELQANVTVDEYYGLFLGVNATSAGFIFDEHGGVCANYNKTAPLSLYVNNSQKSFPGNWKGTSHVVAIKLCILIIIIITGLIGNISVILTIALNRSMRTTVNFYIANLAIADTLTCIFAVPVFYRQFTHHFALGGFVCKIANYALCTCMICSVLTLAVISCDRFMAVFFPLHVRVTKQRKPLVVTFVWVLSLVVSLPYLLAKRMQVIEWKDFQQLNCISDWGSEAYYHKTLGKCTVKGPLIMSVTILMTVFLYFVPIIIMIISYSFILWKLSRTEAPGEKLSESDNTNSSASKRLHKMVFTVLLVFAFCWTPFHIGLLYDITHPKSFQFPKWWRTFAWIAWNIELGNSCMNPIIYAGIKKEFRQGIFAVLRCRKPIIRAKPPQNKRRAVAGGNKPKPQELNLELGIQDPVAYGR